YKAIRQAYLVRIDIESEHFEGEAETPKSPHSVAPPTCRVEETARLAVRVPPVMSHGLSVSDSAFHKRFKSSYDSSPSPTFLVWKRYKGTFEIILDTHSKGDELGEEEDEDEEVDVSHTTTRHKGKEIVKPITHPSETASKEDIDPEQAQRDKDMQKNLALIAKYFKKIYKPTNNNLRTSSNSRNKNVDMTPRYKNDDHSGRFGNQRTVNVAGAREKVGSPVVQQSGIQWFNCKEFCHFAKECRKPKRVKDSAYHKEKIYMAKIQEVPTAKTGTDSEPVEQVQNDAGYNVFSNDLQHSEQSKSVSNTCLVETNDSNGIPDSPDMCEDAIQNDQNDVESIALTNLIANLKLDVDKNKKIQKQLKKANTTLAQELKECKTILVETSQSLGESISVQDRSLVALQNKQTEFEKYKAFNEPYH
nr:hypothetical protein [Tanacetum cinerariifolium]